MPKPQPVPGAKYRYIGATERDFPYPHALTVSPGDIVEVDANPDPNWFEPVAADRDKKE